MTVMSGTLSMKNGNVNRAGMKFILGQNINGLAGTENRVAKMGGSSYYTERTGPYIQLPKDVQENLCLYVILHFICEFIRTSLVCWLSFVTRILH